MERTPSLSVVVATGNLRKLSSRVLQSLLQQDIVEQMEILIVDCASPGMPPFPGSDHPSVRLIVESEAIDFEKAMAIGVREARAPIVAFLEEHCFVLPGWAQALVDAHKEPWGAVCGEVLNGNPGLGVSNAEYLTARNIRWQSPAERGELPMLDGHNSAYKREILMGYGDQLEYMLSAEAVLLFKIKADGYKLLLEPAAKYIHVNEALLSTLPSTLFYWHRVFSHRRAVVFQWSLLQRLQRIAMLPFLPWWHCASTLSYILRRRRDQLWKFIINLPVILFLHYYSNAGQLLGLLFGEGKAAHGFSEMERGVERIPRTDLIAQE